MKLEFKLIEDMIDMTDIKLNSNRHLLLAHCLCNLKKKILNCARLCLMCGNLVIPFQITT